MACRTCRKEEKEGYQILKKMLKIHKHREYGSEILLFISPGLHLRVRIVVVVFLFSQVVPSVYVSLMPLPCLVIRGGERKLPRLMVSLFLSESERNKEIIK